MNLQDWIGREESTEDLISDRLLAGFNATFDLISAPDGIAPVGIHWCLAPVLAPQSGLGPDGHPLRGGFLPPVALPRRMWAGGALKFHNDLRAGDKVARRSRIVAVTEKQGERGRLCFVTIDHEIFSPRGLAIEERHDIVYREAQTGPSENRAAAPAASPHWQKLCRADPVLLFRYSALTFNGHRIHYDRDYATKIEHYQGLLVHGPLQATLLLSFAAACGNARPKRFRFRGISPLTDLETFSLNARAVENEIELWVETDGRRRTMQALAGF